MSIRLAAQSKTLFNYNICAVKTMMQKLIFWTQEQLHRVNSVAANTCKTIHKLQALFKHNPRFSRAYFILCDSHGLQLLIKDVLKLGPFKSIHKYIQTIAVWFKNTALQLSYLRVLQRSEYKEKTHSFILSVITRWRL
jgi:hypothetical protein